MIIEQELATPLGPLTVIARDGALCAVGFAPQREELRRRVRARFAETIEPGAVGATRAIEAYLDGDVHALAGLEVDLGGTGFQARVWAQLREIPPGETTSYGEIARAIGSPEAVRAVGAANGRNPVSLVVPCHRVVGKGGTLTGYAGGLERKRWLLDHEQRHR